MLDYNVVSVVNFLNFETMLRLKENPFFSGDAH